MLSFKPFLQQREDHSQGDLLVAHQRMIASLLDGIVVHAIRGEPKDYARLERDLTELRREVMSRTLDSSELLIATGTAVKTLQEYNRQTGDFLQAQPAELQKITAMLTQAIVNFSVEGSTNVSRLQALERQLEHAAGVEDVRTLKDKLSECLTGIREERFRQKAASDAAVQDLNANLRSVQSGGLPASTAAVDTVTGFQSRPTAEAAIAAAADGGQAVWAVLFVIDHLHGLNARFGRVVGDQTILMFAQHLAQNLRGENTLFRWSGPAFLALLPRAEAQEQIRRELAPLTNARLEMNVEARGRHVLLPVNFSWTLMPIPLAGKAGSIVDRLDAFLASKVGN